MSKLTLTHILLLITVSFTLSGCKAKKQIQPEIAVANSYLQCVVEDLCGNQMDILSLAPPGMCPGHFDISPSQVNQLCKCRILLLFDFQERIADTLSRIKENGLRIYTVKTTPGLCVPRSYLSVAQAVADVLSVEYPAKKDQYNKKLKLIEKRLENLSNELLVMTSGLKKAGVLTSKHQAEFSEWLGLDVISTFAGRDTETAANVNQCLQQAKGKSVRFVIANKQEGTGLAAAIAEHLHARVVVFSNFPGTGNDTAGSGFDRLLLENIQRLLEAVK